MPIQFTIVVPDDVQFKELADEAFKQWLVLHVKSTDTQLSLSKRIGMSYRMVRHYMTRAKVTVEGLLALKTQGGTAFNSIPVTAYDGSTTLYDETSDTQEACQFCGHAIDVHLHHVVNRYDSPVMVALCSKCHRKFHFLNRLYRPPQRKQKTIVHMR